MFRILAPRGRDAQTIHTVLADAEIEAEIVASLPALTAGLSGAAGVVVTEESLDGPDLPALIAQMDAQPAWSDLSFIVLATKQSGSRPRQNAAVLEQLGNTLLLERPLSAATLGRAARAALRARQRQLSVRDMSERLEHMVAERTAALARSEAQLRAMFDGFPDCLFTFAVTEAGPVFDSVNGNAARMMGASADYICGQAPAAVMEPRLAALMNHHIEQSLNTGSTVRYTAEVPGPTPNASPLLVQEVVITPILDETGAVFRLLGVARDVTVRTVLEARLRQAQKMEAVGQLTGGVAHDFNNLLQVVMSGLTLMERATDPARRAQLADSVRRAATRGGELTKRLLTVARRQQLTPVPTDLASWLDDGAEELLSRALRGDIRFLREIENGLPAIEVDQAELELALLNLAVNARDAMPAGGTFAVRATAHQFGPGDDPDGLRGAFVAITLSDTGTGMTAEVQQRVFEPFFTTKGIGQGTGLGLAQVYGFARQSGGMVRLTSQEGQGTTVTLYLPVTTTTAPVSAAPEEEVAQANRGWAILVCEDDDHVAALVIDLLQQLGHTTTRAADAVAALSVLADGHPVDLLFTDVLMPGGMDGLALAREARRQRPGLPVLLTTGYTGGGASATPLGVPMLRKPYAMPDLSKAIERAMAERQLS